MRFKKLGSRGQGRDRPPDRAYPEPEGWEPDPRPAGLIRFNALASLSRFLTQRPAAACYGLHVHRSAPVAEAALLTTASADVIASPPANSAHRCTAPSS